MEDLEVLLNEHPVAGLGEALHGGLVQVHLHTTLFLLQTLFSLGTKNKG